MALTDEAIEKIKVMILSGELSAGDRLPREPDLAAHLGLSRSSLREAVKALSLVNILDVRRGDGTYVTSLEPTVLFAALSFAVDFQRDTSVLEFLRVRRILEPAAAAMAAELITDEKVQGLRELLDRLGPHPDVDALVAQTWSSIGGFRPTRGTQRCARCWTRCPGRPPAPGSAAAWSRGAARNAGWPSTVPSWMRSSRGIPMWQGRGPPCTSPAWSTTGWPPCSDPI